MSFDSNEIVGIKRDSDSLFVESNTGKCFHRALSFDVTNNSIEVKKSKRGFQSSFPVTTGWIEPYDAFKSEGRPRLAIYHPSFEKTENMVTRVCDGFEAVFKQCRDGGYCDPQIETIVEKSLRTMRYPPNKYPSVQSVGFLGPAGVGKSSGMNCYVSMQAAAVENDLGARGTNVVHEYSNAMPMQIPNFLVRVRYLRLDQIKKLIRGHCHNIFEHINLSHATLEELEEDEIKDMKEKHDTGLDFFMTILREDEDFEDADEASEYFKERKSEDESDVAQELSSLVDKLLDAQDIKANGMTKEYPAEHESELTNIFQKISGPPSFASGGGKKSSLWPLIIKVEVHHDKDMLNAGVVLGDAPGVTDTNRTVVQNTKSYLKNAGTILVFATPSRIEKNPELEANLRACIRLGKMHQTYLVITMIDNKTTIKDAERPNFPQEDQDALEDAELYVERIKQDSERTTLAKKRANDLEEFKMLDDHQRELEVLEKLASMKVKQTAIEIRNRLILRSLKNKFRELSGSKKAPDLKIFFTSNQEYQKHLAGYDAKDPPILDIQGTGIPAVRRMLYEIPARGKVNTLTRIVRSRLPSIFSGIIGILTKSDLERKQDVENLIAKIMDQDAILVHQITEEVEVKFKDVIVGTMKANDGKWTAAALAKLSQWQEIKPGTFAAFCRRVGFWKRAGGFKVNWNAEIQLIFSSKLNAAFNTFEEEMDVIERDAISSIEALYRSLLEELETCEGFQGIDEKPFFKHINIVKDATIGQFKKNFDRFSQNIAQIRSSATMLTDLQDGNAEDSYVVSAMQDTYLECLKASSTSIAAPVVTFVNAKGKTRKRSGPHCARVDLLRKRLAGVGTESVFRAVADVMSAGFADQHSYWKAKCYQTIGGGTTSVKNDFDTRFQTPDVVKDEEHIESVAKLQEAAQEALDRVLGEMKEELEKGVAYEKSGGPMV